MFPLNSNSYICSNDRNLKNAAIAKHRNGANKNMVTHADTIVVVTSSHLKSLSISFFEFPDESFEVASFTIDERTNIPTTILNMTSTTFRFELFCRCLFMASFLNFVRRRGVD